MQVIYDDTDAAGPIFASSTVVRKLLVVKTGRQ